jgi:hypothetical protein
MASCSGRIANPMTTALTIASRAVTPKALRNPVNDEALASRIAPATVGLSTAPTLPRPMKTPRAPAR